MQHLASYVETLPPIKRDRLYDNPWTCQALLRSLPSIVQQYVLRLLYITEPVSLEDVNSWARAEYRSAHEGAIQTLLTLDVFKLDATQQTLQLHPRFQAQVRWALTGGGQRQPQQLDGAAEAAPTAAELDDYAQAQWEAMLMYLIGERGAEPDLPHYLKAARPLRLRQLFTEAGLLASYGRDATSVDGFKFLLMDTFSQLWVLLRQYIRSAEGTAGSGSSAGRNDGSGAGSELSSVLSFLMQLGFRRVGQPVPFDALSRMEGDIAVHMVQLGLLYPFQVKGRSFFCPTRLAASLCGGFTPGAVSSEVAGGHIIVETNYKVYAYTTSAIQRVILSYFVRIEAELPNVLAGTITRDSANAALRQGISAQQIIHYLQSHAHPHIANRVPVVPEAVADQIRLWEAESLRLREQPAYMYSQFDTEQLYVSALQYAQTLGILLCNDQKRRQFLCKASGHDAMRAHIQRQKAQHK